MTTSSAATAPPRPSLTAALAHVVLTLWVGVVLFSFTVTMLALSVGLLPAFLLGVPVAAVTFWMVRVFARLERGRIHALLGLEIPAPYPVAPAGARFLPRLWAELRSGTQWRQVAYCIALLPVSCVTFSLVMATWGAGAALFTTIAWSARMDRAALPLLDELWK